MKAPPEMFRASSINELHVYFLYEIESTVDAVNKLFVVELLKHYYRFAAFLLKGFLQKVT